MGTKGRALGRGAAIILWGGVIAANLIPSVPAGIARIRGAGRVTLAQGGGQAAQTMLEIRVAYLERRLRALSDALASPHSYAGLPPPGIVIPMTRRTVPEKPPA